MLHKLVQSNVTIYSTCKCIRHYVIVYNYVGTCFSLSCSPGGRVGSSWDSGDQQGSEHREKRGCVVIQIMWQSGICTLIDILVVVMVKPLCTHNYGPSCFCWPKPQVDLASGEWHTHQQLPYLMPFPPTNYFTAFDINNPWNSDWATE